MADLITFWTSVDLNSTVNLLNIILFINIILSSILIIQNFRSRRNYKELRKTNGTNYPVPSTNKIPPSPTEISQNLQAASTPDVEQSKLNRIVKMVKENRSREEIEKAIDIEDEYLSILMQNYK